MGLKAFNAKHSYRTGRDNLLEDFYIPALAEASRYDRAVGFFSSSIFSYAAQGVSAFFGPNNGRMRLIFGGELSAEDYEAALRGESQRSLSDLLESTIDAAIDRVLLEIDRRRLELLSLLIAFGRLEIKFAMRPRGMFHEKYGILYDAELNALAFDGSANESAMAFFLYGNWERIRTYRSWVSGQLETVSELARDFDALWQGREEGCITVPLPQASREKLIRAADRGLAGRLSPTEELELAKGGSPVKEENSALPQLPFVPKMLDGHPLSMRSHQIESLRKWKASDYQGIAALCTGSGKTIMAAYAICRVFEAHGRLFCVVAVPFIVLAEQWCDVLQQFGIVPVRCWSAQNWDERLRETVTQFLGGARRFACIVAVNATMSSDELRLELNRIENAPFLMIGDECHHHRQLAQSGGLPLTANMRLGLSATPLHYRDEAGNKALTSYYGSVVAEYALQQALADDVLSPYDYYPIVVDLTEEERRAYRDVSAKIAQLFAAGIDDDDDERLGALLRHRAEIVAVAENKEQKLKTLLERELPQPLTLIYCGVDSDRGGDGRQIERITRLLADRGWNVARYTARERTLERRMVLDGFRAGFVDALVAMRCLDEGVDVPGCRTAFILASAADPRQFIQRRGRLLRKAPGKSHARIYDFIVTPGDLSAFADVDRRLVARELVRVKEFASLARNRAEALTEVMAIAATFDLVHEL